MWALVAVFIKATTDTLTQFGVGGMFTRWPVYALAASGVAGFAVMCAGVVVLTQTAPATMEAGIRSAGPARRVDSSP
jgi:hypothetical protein